MTPDTAVNRDKLVHDIKIVVADAEELLRATANQAGEKATVAREKIQESLQRAKVKLSDVEQVAVERTKQAANATDHYVRENPWAAVGIAAGAGLLLGLLIGRR
jgi:ElaB/YqjD/DUF883 family membrane-anchored ribosome-binding protein